MDALQRLQAFDEASRGGRALRCENGLPAEVREGAALCTYGWSGGELASIVEPDGTRYDYRYGDDGRLLDVDRNGRPWARYAYDPAGRLASVERADGPRAYDYDAGGRLQRTRRGPAGPYVYRWADGRVADARCDDEHTAFAYDAAGRLVGLVQRIAGITLATRFVFDADARLAAIEFPDWQQRIGFTWDARGRATAVSWNGREVVRVGTDDTERLAWSEWPNGVRAQTWHEAASGRPVSQRLSHDGRTVWQSALERDECFRLRREGERRHSYDPQGRLIESTDGERTWRYRYDASDAVSADGDHRHARLDAIGRVEIVYGPDGERVFRYDESGDLESLLVNGECVARCLYDHKGRLAMKHGAAGSERFLYGADDGLLAVADGDGRPRLIVLRLPTGIVGLVDFRRDPQGEVLSLHADSGGNLVFTGDEDGRLERPVTFDPFGLPLQEDGRVPAIFRGRFWHADLGLYRIGGRWYDPGLRRFLTPDSHTGAPDDARLVSPFVNAGEQRMARTRLLACWLREPRLRCRFAYCANDPVNRFDPDGHWSFGGVLLSLLGVIWTLPNTAFGLAIEVSCLIGEVVRWIVYAFTLGHVSWQTPGFDVAASGRLNAFALVFKGGWLGSFESLLGITFGNVIFVNGEYEQHPAFKALPDPVSPPAYNGTETVPKAQALYEHELRHVNQYGWFGPFFHLGLPLFGVYEWDVIFNGYQDASLEKDARDHSGF
jgi:RHS repeat-associated protein